MEDERSAICVLGSVLDETDVEFSMNVVNCKIPAVREMLVMGSRSSHEADTMSAMRHRMTKAISAIRTEMYFYNTPGILERRVRTRGTNRLHRPACCTRQNENVELDERAGRHAAWLRGRMPGKDRYTKM